MWAGFTWAKVGYMWDGMVAYLLGAGAFAGRDAVHALRRKVAGWRNPKTLPTQKRDSDESGQ